MGAKTTIVYACDPSRSGEGGTGAEGSLPAKGPATPVICYLLCGPLAQLAEQLTLNWSDISGVAYRVSPSENPPN